MIASSGNHPTKGGIRERVPADNPIDDVRQGAHAQLAEKQWIKAGEAAGRFAVP